MREGERAALKLVERKGKGAQFSQGGQVIVLNHPQLCLKPILFRYQLLCSAPTHTIGPLHCFGANS